MVDNVKGRVMGVDPGTARLGYGVLDVQGKERFAIVEAGIIETPKSLGPGQRLAMIRQDLLSLLEKYQPAIMSVEAIFFFRNAKTLVPVAQARGVILEAAAHSGVPIVEYTPMQVKLTLTGFGRADKKLVQTSVARLLAHDTLIRPDDAADAIALAICHARMGFAAESFSLSPSPLG